MKAKKMLFLGVMLFSVVVMQAKNDLSQNTPKQDAQEFTLEVYGGEVPDVKPAFEEEHFLGDAITKKWNTFLCNYTHTYDVEVGLNASGTEFRKPAVFKAVERANKYVKKSFKAHQMSKDEAVKIMAHVLDCANIICLENDTEALETAAANTKTGEEAVEFFNHIKLVNA